MILDPANDDLALDDGGKGAYRMYMGLAALDSTGLFATFDGPILSFYFAEKEEKN